MKLIVYASGVRAAAVETVDGLAHYNITAPQGAVFSIIAERETAEEPGIVRAKFFTLPDDTPHPERAYPFCLDGDHPQTAADTGTIAFQKPDGTFATPNFISLAEGRHRFDVSVDDAQGGVHVFHVQINVGEANWVTPAPEEPEIPEHIPLIFPDTMWVSTGPTARGVPLEKLREFTVKLVALYREYEYVPPEAGEDGGDGSGS